ncbi:MAG TPA: terminase family protein [Bryobacteraceae bacterium]|nr:terminase family protein [Bryobacteraceae bacterium]
MGRPGGSGECCFRGIKYAALPSQARFHKSAARFKGFSGPIGSGKSQALCQEAVKLAYVNAGRTGLLGAPTYPMLRDVTQAALFELLGTNRIPYEHNKSENTLTFRDTGSRVLFRAVDEFDRLRGTNLAWFGLDELTYTQEAAWQVLEGRLRDSKASRLCGFAAWTPKGFDWVYRRFLHEPVAGYEAIIAKPFENRFLLDRIPDFYERLRNSYDENFYKQEVLGEYLSLSGSVVYHAFRRAEHVKDVKVDKEVPLLWALDFNVDPMCSVVAQKIGDVVHVVDEIVISRASTEEACEEFHRRFPQHMKGVVIYGDATGARMQTAGSSDYEIVRNYFRREGYTDVEYKVPRSNPPVRERVELVNAKLRSAAGEMRLVVDGKCRELMRDFEEVSYKADTTVIDKDKNPKRTHLSDALGYLIWQECRIQAPVGERPERLF